MTGQGWLAAPGVRGPGTHKHHKEEREGRIMDDVIRGAFYGLAVFGFVAFLLTIMGGGRR